MDDQLTIPSNGDSMPMGGSSGHPGSDPITIYNNSVSGSSGSSSYGDSGIGINPSSGSSNTINQSDDAASQEGADISLSQYLKDHPGASYDDVLKFMSLHSDEWAEKYLDYLVEKGEIDKQNQYTAQREDTAYQRLVRDLKRAGLNPALMLGTSASPSSASSVGYTRMSEGANSRSIGNYTKLKSLILAFMSFELNRQLGQTNSIFTNGEKFTGMLKDLFRIFS